MDRDIARRQDAAIPEPLYTQPDAFVEHVYPHPLSTQTPDLESQTTTSEYLVERMRDAGPQERTQVVFTPSGKTMPTIRREVIGTEPKYHRVRTDEWAIRPRTAIAVMAGSFALFNVAPIIGDVGDEASKVVYEVESLLGTNRSQERRDISTMVPTTERSTAITEYVIADGEPGSTTADDDEIESFRSSVRAAALPGADVQIKITAFASDEYGVDASIGTRESANEEIAEARQAAWSDAIENALPSATVRNDAVQGVLSPRQVRKLERLAEAAGFGGENPMMDAIRAAEAGQATPALRRYVAKHFKRGVELTARIENPEKTRMIDVTDQGYVTITETEPEDPNRDYTPLFIPMPWFRRRRRQQDGERDIKRWRIRPGTEILKPQVLRETLDQAWLRVRPEAVTDKNTLVDDAWAYTQKYEHLLRDGRVAEVLRADIKDGDKESALRIFFVDKKPEPQTVAAYSKLLESFATMKTPDGQRVADNVSGIFVLPSEHAGRDVKNPKLIGVGIDHQYDEDVLGVMYYPLKLVELHMPMKLDGAELEEYLDSYRGSVWTMAHEVGGHGTDVAAEPMVLCRVHSRHVANAYVIDGDPRAHRMAGLTTELRPLAESAIQDETRMFDITYPVLDKDGATFMMTARVNEHDSRLAHAHTAIIVGRQHTQYAGESDTEHYAEVAAAATGITVDYDEAGMQVDQIEQNGVRARFANGYHPAPEVQALYAESVGLDQQDDESQPDVTIVSCAPEDDPLLRKHMIRARQVTMPKPKEQLAILAQTSRRQR